MERIRDRRVAALQARGDVLVSDSSRMIALSSFGVRDWLLPVTMLVYNRTNDQKCSKIAESSVPYMVI
jgi:hypothetical protein